MQRASVQTRVSILSRINSGDPDEDSPYPALIPTAYVHLDDIRPRVTHVPGSEAIAWPDDTFFPPHIPKVVALNVPEGKIADNVTEVPDGESTYAASLFHAAYALLPCSV